MTEIVQLHRWRANIRYRTKNGFDTRTATFEELFELHAIIEDGPDWNTIVDVVVVLARKTSDYLTVEEALEK